MTKEERKQYAHEYYVKHRKKADRCCKICGGELDNNNQTYCLDCLLRDFANGYKTGDGYFTACRRLCSRGYDVKQMVAEAQERGYI